jgi:hypothetical protein
VGRANKIAWMVATQDTYIRNLDRARMNTCSQNGARATPHVLSTKIIMPMMKVHMSRHNKLIGPTSQGALAKTRANDEAAGQDSDVL